MQRTELRRDHGDMSSLQAGRYVRVALFAWSGALAACGNSVVRLSGAGSTGVGTGGAATGGAGGAAATTGSGIGPPPPSTTCTLDTLASGLAHPQGIMAASDAVYVLADTPSSSELLRVPLAGGAPVVVADASGDSVGETGTVAVDGSHIAWVSSDGSLRVMPTGGGATTLVVGSGGPALTQLVLSNDAVYAASDGAEVLRFPLAGGDGAVVVGPLRERNARRLRGRRREHLLGSSAGQRSILRQPSLEDADRGWRSRRRSPTSEEPMRSSWFRATRSSFRTGEPALPHRPRASLTATAASFASRRRRLICPSDAVLGRCHSGSRRGRCVRRLLGWRADRLRRNGSCRIPGARRAHLRQWCLRDARPVQRDGRPGRLRRRHLLARRGRRHRRTRPLRSERDVEHDRRGRAFPLPFLLLVDGRVQPPSLFLDLQGAPCRTLRARGNGARALSRGAPRSVDV